MGLGAERVGGCNDQAPTGAGSGAVVRGPGLCRIRGAATLLSHDPLLCCHTTAPQERPGSCTPVPLRRGSQTR